MAQTAGSARDFVEKMVAGGTSRPVAEELERRIAIIESDEGSHDARQHLTSRELAVYLGATVLACLIGLAVVAL